MFAVNRLSTVNKNSPRYVLIFLAIFLAVIQTTSVAAEGGFVEPPAITNREKAHLNILFTGEGNGTQEDPCSASGTTPGTFNSADNLKNVFDYMRAQGLSPEQAAGVVGNIAVESGGNPINAQVGPDTKDPTQFGTEVGVGKAWGLIQWDAGGRVIGYANQANVTGPIHELLTQLDIVWWHMNNTSPTSAQNMYKDYQNVTDVVAATRMYEERMEGAGIPHMEDRERRAKEALRTYGGGGSTTSPGSPTSPSCGPEGGVASSNGFTFPLITTQNAITSHKPYPWCSQATSNCHHDYKAADIMIETGTVIIAAKSGTVQNVNRGNTHPNNVTISTDDKQGINYYTHMGANTAAVREGQHVDAGDELGKVGTSVDAMGTDPHLHFDMLPPKYKFRPSCSGDSCAKYPFIEVQPALIETFKLLPQG